MNMENDILNTLSNLVTFNTFLADVYTYEIYEFR